MMKISFENKVALVTGAGSGLGLATVRAFAEAGASVVLADWHEESVRSAAKKLTVQGYKALAIRCDVSNESEVEDMVRNTIATFGRLDAAYNNAGVQNVLAETADTTREDYDRVMGINLRGIWSAMRSELQFMRNQGSGSSSIVRRWEDLSVVPSAASITQQNTGCLVSPRAPRWNTRPAASASMPYALVLSKPPCQTKWSPPVRVTLSRHWRRAYRWHESDAPTRLQVLFCGFAVMPPAT
jgi:NAD(P)-dependent dehydrogenase (short-subunit alcohol dehydrogenase family)